MITEGLAQLSTVFRRRFLFNALLPTLVFSTLLVALFATQVASLHGIGLWWTGLDGLSKALVALAYLAGVWFLAGAVASQWRNIIRLFEGYPVMRILGTRTPGLAWHSRRAHRLWQGEDPDAVEDDDAEAEDHDGRGPRQSEAYRQYLLVQHDGDEREVLPTRLGNILRAGERYPLTHYGMDAIYFWPRLFPLLPAQFQDDYEKFMQQYELPLVIAFQTAASAMVGGILLLASSGPPMLFLSWFAGGVVLAYLFYWLALPNAMEIAEQQRTAFDLYRHLLLEQWPTPSDVNDERMAFKAIEEFVVGNIDPAWGKPQQLHRRRHRKAT
jgi:hypothetical protein